MTSKFFMSVLVPCSILLPIVIGLLKLQRLPVNAKIIWYYLIVSAVISAASIFMGRVLHTNNMPLVHLYTPIELAFFCWFYTKILAPKRPRFLNIWLPLLFMVLCIINALRYQSIYTYCSYTRSVEALICIILALNYFAKMATYGNEKKSMSKPGLYFNSGIFLYFSGGFMLFVFSNLIVNLPRSNFMVILVIYAALVLCMYLLFSVAFLLCKK
jgi:hypothetical protein